MRGMETNHAAYAIIFDGGARGNPGKGYGSYEVRAGGASDVKRLTFGNRDTNNEAEYRTLIVALRDVLGRIAAAGGDPKATAITVRGDSQLVINQVNGTWKVKTPHIRPLHAEATALLSRFGTRSVAWHGRANSVRALGH